MSRPAAGLAALALLFGAGGCAGGCAAPRSTKSVPAAPAASSFAWDPSTMPDPCRVVSQSEVAGAVGTAVSAGTRLQSWPPLCRFVIDAGSATFVYVSDDSRPTAVEDFENNLHTTSATDLVTGIGDQAYWLPQSTALHVLGGGTQLVVMFRGGKVPADPLDVAVRLARIALPRARP